jgi:hypothetical protein
VDDSSGVNMECTIAVTIEKKDPSKVTTLNLNALEAALDSDARVPKGLDVGNVVDVKGKLGLFRNQKQIKIEKVALLRSTQEEVDFWTKMRGFRSDVLDKPWELGEKQLRKRRREAEGPDERRQRKRKRRQEREAEELRRREEQQQKTETSKKPTGLERKAKRPARQGESESQGKYSALGL